MFPIILQVYFITVLFLLILQCICPNFRSYPQRASITCILNFFTFLCLMCLFADAIWGIVEFFRLDSNCQVTFLFPRKYNLPVTWHKLFSYDTKSDYPYDAQKSKNILRYIFTLLKLDIILF